MKSGFIVFAAVLAIVSGLTGCQIFRNSETWCAVTRIHPPGKGDPDRSSSYAHDLQQQLTAKGIHSWVVTYDFVDITDRSERLVKRSAVIYRDPEQPDSPWWWTDNLRPRPVWLPNATVQKQVVFATHETPRTVSLDPKPKKHLSKPGRTAAKHSAAPPRKSRVHSDLKRHFKQTHGSTYNARSAADRKKMARLKKRS